MLSSRFFNVHPVHESRSWLCTMAAQSDHERHHSNTSLLQKLASAVDGHAATATFACGGSVPILDLSKGKFDHDAQNLAAPITIRWDPRNTDTTQSKIAFPLPEHDKVSREMFHKLLHHCDPATFGVGGRDILDEAYRKAAKLDASDFSTDFHPHDCGILDSIQQILLPSTIRGGQGIGIGPQGVRAQLYKLNVCTSSMATTQSQTALIENSRSTLHLQANSCLTWILHVESCNLAHSLCACPINMKVRDSDILPPPAEHFG